ncbi:signal peptide peptidase SppA [Novosphingobium sp. YJ-S2-02]|uniref:Signal peptide peptidase SppA n=1 Tax=Novosphingobium aureum TaxID=2792964 RepID=A0A931HAP0_9SPHN|nr:signal peptide peptidase SppA [Novosphingobium aureum]MBH0112471.1 signal peptide peptidase SppA [Novosphingobium aureum]
MKFAGKVWRLLVGIKDALALLFLMLFFSLLFGALTMRPAPGRIEDGALLLDLDGMVVEEKSAPDPFNLLLSGSAPVHEFPVRDLERALRGAAKDDHVKAVVLDLSHFLGGGQVHMRAVGEAIDAVRAAGKPVLTFANAYADDGALLAAHASEVWVDPMGGSFVAGPGGNSLYFKGLLDRFKVNAHVYRAGTFKSAVEPYIREDMSPEARLAYEDVYGALWQGWQADVRKARPKARLDAMVADPAGWVAQHGNDMAAAAKAAGLVDRIGDKTEFGLRVAKLVGDETGKSDLAYAHTPLATWLAANPEKQEGAKIGVVTIAGTIVDGDAGPGEAGGDRIAQLLDDNIDEGFKALVVRVDSPGGSAMAAERIRRAIVRYKDRKIPVVVSMGNLAASGGYWVSTPAQQIFAEPDTITGSIGVFAVVTSFERTLSDFGVTSDGVKTTPLSGEPDILGGFSPEVEKLLQTSVEGTYGKFVDLAAKSRKMSAEELDAVAQGRVWPGAEARERGLVDAMGDLDDALAYAARVGGVGNGKWHAVYLSGEKDPVSQLVASLFSDSGEQAAVTDFASLVSMRQQAQLGQARSQLMALLSHSGVQAFCATCPVAPTGGKTLGAPERKLGWMSGIFGGAH